MLCSNCSEVIKPLVAVDIDGTLGDYHGHFIEFAQAYLGRPLPYEYDGSYEFSEYLQLRKSVYREVKLAYRQGGMKRSMPLLSPSSYTYSPQEFIKELRKKGIEVWLTTTRPYMRLDNIDPDTREWLFRNRIGYDGLLYGEEKYRLLCERVDKSRILAVVDDQRPMLAQAAELGLYGIQRWSSWNEGDRQSPGSSQLHEIRWVIMERERRWRSEQTS
jgi:phosphoglycolate phosphatase-like HAD superfamily hydrolase